MEKNKDKWYTDLYWLSPYNWLEEVRKEFNLPKRVMIHEVTLREIDQNPNVALNKGEKIRIAEALDDLGVWSIEIAPAVSKEDEETTKELAGLGLKAKVIAFTSWNKENIDLCRKCDVEAVIVDYTGNPWQAKTFWGFSPEQHIDKAIEAMKYAKDHGLFVVALPWDNYKAPLDFLEKMYKRIAEEKVADHISISETFGFALPWTTIHLIKKVKSWIGEIPLQKHGHNDFGLATIDMIAAVCGGAEVPHTTLLASGERAGNASTEEVAVDIELLLGVNTGINLEKIYDVAMLFQDLTGIKIPPNKPIVGENLHTTMSGWVYWMKKKALQANEVIGMIPFKPELVGFPSGPEGKVVLGKGAGRSLVKECLEKIGVKVSDEELSKITEEVKKESIFRKRSIDDRLLKEIVKKISEK